MAAEKTMAIVLRMTDFSETSCVVTLFTREFGKLSALAKGARRPKSPFEAALDVLSVCRVVFLRKSGDTLHLLTEAKLERRFRGASRSLERLYSAYYVVELLGRMTDQMDVHPELYDLATEAIFDLDRFPTTGESCENSDISMILLRYQMRMLFYLGHAPSLRACVECGQVLEWEASKRIPFGLNAGGVLCNRCKHVDRNIVSLSNLALQGLINTVESNFETGLLTSRSLPLGEMRGLVDQYIAYLMGSKPKVMRFLRTAFIR